ncbi:MAG: hypothetical protein AAFY57_17105 [Cyanobacteria bacterium J06642_2]
MAHIHQNHDHVHGADCGHTAIVHDGHVDYLHDGHLHHQTAAGVVEEHAIPVSEKNPDICTNGHTCTGHDADHVHGAGCGHEPVPHGDHICYLVDGHLHYQHDGHCDDHGPIEVVN